MLSPSPDTNASQPLAGQLVVFTGKLSSLRRSDARALVARLGGATGDEVNAKTTLVVVGAEGFVSPPHEKSNKLKRAEDLKIRVITEEEFCRIAEVPTPENCKSDVPSGAIRVATRSGSFGCVIVSCSPEEALF